MTQPQRKYGNRKVQIDGYTFDSAAEARRYGELRLLEQAGEIEDIRVHWPYEMVVEGVTGPMHICTYEADFVYMPKHHREWVGEDVKGKATDVYKLKKKLLRALWGLEITEIEA